METPSESSGHLGEAARRIAQRMLVIMENRIQLLLMEAQEERERALLAIWLALGAAAFGLLAGVALTMMIAVVLWEHSPYIALLVLAAVYSIAALIFYNRLVRLQRNWETLPHTLDQLRKDRACLEKTFN